MRARPHVAGRGDGDAGVEPIMVRVAADYLTRDPVPYLIDAGFVIESVARTGRGGVTLVVARKPEVPSAP